MFTASLALVYIMVLSLRFFLFFKIYLNYYFLTFLTNNNWIRRFLLFCSIIFLINAMAHLIVVTFVYTAIYSLSYFSCRVVKTIWLFYFFALSFFYTTYTFGFPNQRYCTRHIVQLFPQGTFSSTIFFPVCVCVSVYVYNFTMERLQDDPCIYCNFCFLFHIYIHTR